MSAPHPLSSPRSSAPMPATIIRAVGQRLPSAPSTTLRDCLLQLHPAHHSISKRSSHPHALTVATALQGRHPELPLDAPAELGWIDLTDASALTWYDLPLPHQVARLYLYSGCVVQAVYRVFDETRISAQPPVFGPARAEHGVIGPRAKHRGNADFLAGLDDGPGNGPGSGAEGAR